MTTAYTSLLGLALPVTGELSGTWGDTVNNSITSLLDSAVAGTTNVSTDGDVTLTTTTGAANTAREAILLFSGARTALRTVTAPAQSKVYTVINATTGGYSVKLVGSGPTTGVTIVAGESAVCAWNGSDFIKISNTSGAGVFTSVTDSGLTSGRVTYATTAGLLTDSANLLYSGTDLTVYGITVGRGAGAVATNTAVGGSSLAANTTGNLNTSVGYYSMVSNTTGNSNTALGYYALSANLGGYANVAVGRGALVANTSGFQNIAIGSQDEISIYGPLRSNLTGAANLAIGNGALQANTSGNYNVAVGHQALTSNVTGLNQTAVGYQALYAANNGTNNGGTAVGYRALFNSTGPNNVAVGQGAGQAVTTGDNNTFVGWLTAASGAGFTGSSNSFYGSGSGYVNTSGSSNSFYGTSSGYTNSTGSNNVAVGASALYSNTTASNSTAVGAQALNLNTGANNTAVGYQAALGNTTGQANTAIGFQVKTGTTASNVTAIGSYVGNDTMTGNNNTLVGQASGVSLTTGQGNTFVGAAGYINQGSGGLITTGNKNTILGPYNGNQGGLDIRTASNYIVLSDGDGNPRQGIDSNGNIFYGTTPAAWGSAWRAMQLGTQASWYTNNDFTRFALNVYGDSVYTERYLTSDHAQQYIQASGNHTFMSSASGNAGDAISWTTVLNFNKDTTIALQGASMQSGTGITFPATQSASSNANTLDDYEEGTWTPVFRGSSTAGSYTLSVNSGGAYYTKIGRQVTVNGAFNITAVGSAGTGYAQITGLPFTNTGQTSGSCYFQNVDLDAGCLWCDVEFISDTGVTTLYFNTIRDNAVSIDTQIAGFGSSSYIRFSLTYTTNT